MRKLGSVFLSLLLALSLAACGGGTKETAPAQPSGGQTAAPAKKVKVAGLFTQKVTEGNWDVVGFAAFKKMAEKHGFEYAYAEAVDYNKTAETVRDFASRGYDLVIAHSSGYGSGVLEVAKEFPKTKFAVVSALKDTGGNPNVSGWEINWVDLGYQIGLVAGYASKSGKLGVVNAEVIPAFTKATAGFIEGAKYANPSADVRVAFIGSFTDAAKGKQLTLAQISQGVDFVYPLADTAALGVFEAAKEKKILSVGMYLDESKVAPEVITTSMVIDFNRIYDEIGQKFKSNTLESKVYYQTAKDGYFKFAPYNHLSADTVKKVTAALDKIKSGEIKIPDVDYQVKK